MTAVVLKVSSSALHIYIDHKDADDVQDKCELCEYAVQNQDMDAYVPVLHFELVLLDDNFSEEKNFYHSVDRKIALTSILFGRPPPSIL